MSHSLVISCIKPVLYANSTSKLFLLANCAENSAVYLKCLNLGIERVFLAIFSKYKQFFPMYS